MAVAIILHIAFAVAVIAGVWKAFEKAGAQGWAESFPSTSRTS